ncbi:metal-sensing transcriptional repressor (plasmid) [Rubrobacter marinus]|uniref:Metal-sensing transcriptional repressor n=1 Tax=Rubrobacter marinus TaxID=2653852 RepID=A0A6G8Q3H0_9ACTN|nr:metal-sensitive transcriptional regulator [Rubrobacter marinus]QIN80995.1 metal-sensing transcriptional repressor [Rubrobacter marinus]
MSLVAEVHPDLSGYIKAGNKAKLAERLDRIEGQARGIKRMVDREAYCVDILTQIASLVAASERVASILLEDHMDHCVREALENGESAEEKIEEIKAAVERFRRI